MADDIIRNINVQIIDNETGEILYNRKSTQPIRFFTDKRKNFLAASADSFVRGLLANKFLSLHIDVFPLDSVISKDLFDVY